MSEFTEKYLEYRLKLFLAAKNLKEYLKGTMVKKGSVYVPKEPKRSGKFTKKHFNFKVTKIRRRMQKLSRRRNRRR